MNEKEIKVLIFNLNNEYYATEIIDVERILEYSQPTKLPDIPNFVEGVINYEGNILPVVNIARRFNMDEKEKNGESKIIVIKDGVNKVGMIVDLVSEVRDVPRKNVENPPEIAIKISKRYIKGLIKLENKIIIFLDLAKILSQEEKTYIY